MKTSLKSVIEVLDRDANQLEHHAQKLKAISPDISPDLESDAELIDQRVASIRKEVEILERWEWNSVPATTLKLSGRAHDHERDTARTGASKNFARCVKV